MRLGASSVSKVAFCGAVVALLMVGCRQPYLSASKAKDQLTPADIDLFQKYTTREMIIGPNDVCSLQAAVGEVVTSVTKGTITSRTGFEHLAPFLTNTHRNAMAGWAPESLGCMHALVAGCGEDPRDSGDWCLLPGTGLLLRDASNGDADMRALFVAHWLFVREQTFHYMVGHFPGLALRLMENLAQDANDQEIKAMAAAEVDAVKALRENRQLGETKLKAVIDTMLPKLSQIGVSQERIKTFLADWEQRAQIAWWQTP